MSAIHDDPREDQREASIARDLSEGSVGLPGGGKKRDGAEWHWVKRKSCRLNWL
jgi:hypothetical protein